MNLNHLDLPVCDVGASRSFFERYFGFKCIFVRGDGLIVLLDEDGFALTLSQLPSEETLKYPTGFHIGFNVDSEDDLFEVHKLIVTAGVPIVRAIGKFEGATTFHCLAPGPILVEVAYRSKA